MAWDENAEVRRKKISEQQASELFSQIRQVLHDASDAPTGELLLLPLGSILKTSSGKIQRYAIKQAYLNGQCIILASAEQSHDGYPSAAITTFDSLRIVEFKHAIDASLDIELPLAALLPEIADLGVCWSSK